MWRTPQFVNEYHSIFNSPNTAWSADSMFLTYSGSPVIFKSSTCFGHHGVCLAVLMSNAEFWVDMARFHSTLFVVIWPSFNENARGASMVPVAARSQCRSSVCGLKFS